MDLEIQTKNFLLNQLDDESRLSFERRLLEDDHLFEQASALDEDLVDSLVDGSLPRAEADALKQRLMAGQAGRHQIALSLALVDKAKRHQEAPASAAKQAALASGLPAQSHKTPTPFWRRWVQWLEIHPHAWAAAAALLTGLVVGIPAHLHQDTLESENLFLAQKVAQLTSEIPSFPPVQMSFELRALSRSPDAGTTLRLPKETNQIELWLETPYKNGTFKALVKSDERVILEAADLEIIEGTSEHFAVLDIAVDSLPSPQLEIELQRLDENSWQPVGSFSVHISPQ